MAQGDRKIYIGETLVSDKSMEDLSRLVDQLKDYLIANGGHDSGINADLLDGHHSTDFATREQGEIADNSLQLGQVRIGNVSLINGENTLHSNAVVLSNDSTASLTNTNSTICEPIILQEVEECLRCLGINNESNISLEDALLFLRCLLFRVVKNINENKVDMEYQDPDETIPKMLSDNNFSNYYRGLLDTLGELRKFMDGESLNATSVNGIRFRLITQEQYDALSEDAKLDPFMIYITVDEIPPEYQPPSADGEPPSVVDFKVVDNDEGNLGIWYRNSYATDQRWHELITFKDIFDSFDFNEILKPKDVAEVINSFTLQQTEDSIFLAKNPYKDIVLSAIQGVKYKNNIISPNVNNIIELPNFITESDLINNESIDNIKNSIDNIIRTLNTQNQNISNNANAINNVRSTVNTKSNIGHTHSINEITDQKLYYVKVPPTYTFLSSCGNTDQKIHLKRVGNMVELSMNLGYLRADPQTNLAYNFVNIGAIPKGFRNFEAGIYGTPYIMAGKTRGIYYAIISPLTINDYTQKTENFTKGFPILNFYSDHTLGNPQRFICQFVYPTMDPFPTEEIVKTHYNYLDNNSININDIEYKEINLNTGWD